MGRRSSFRTDPQGWKFGSESSSFKVQIVQRFFDRRTEYESSRACPSNLWQRSVGVQRRRWRPWSVFTDQRLHDRYNPSSRKKPPKTHFHLYARGCFWRDGISRWQHPIRKRLGPWGFGSFMPEGTTIPRITWGAARNRNKIDYEYRSWTQQAIAKDLRPGPTLGGQLKRS